MVDKFKFLSPYLRAAYCLEKIWNGILIFPVQRYIRYLDFDLDQVII